MLHNSELVSMSKSFDIALETGNDKLAYGLYAAVRGWALDAMNGMREVQSKRQIIWLAGRMGQFLDSHDMSRVTEHTSPCSRALEVARESLIKHYFKLHYTEVTING